MKLLSKSFNLCGHDTSTSQTETDDYCRSNTALCVALRGKSRRDSVLCVMILSDLNRLFYFTLLSRF